MKRASKKLISLFMVACLVLGMIPLTAAAETSGCTHVHDSYCGYVEAAPCGHIHDEICGEDGADCTHDCTDGTCGYIAEAPCGHVHDEGCGGMALGDSGNTVKTISDFEPLPVATLEAATGTALGDLLLPDELKATADGAAADVPVQVWEAKLGTPAYDKDTAGDYLLVPVFYTGYTVADGVALPEILVTLIPPAPGNTAKTVTAFASLDFAVQFQYVVSGALKADLNLPDTLDATIDGQTETIPGVTWACAEYNEATGMTEAEYEWKAALPEGYTVAEGVETPAIRATVGGVPMAPMALAFDFGGASDGVPALTVGDGVYMGASGTPTPYPTHYKSPSAGKAAAILTAMEAYGDQTPAHIGMSAPVVIKRILPPIPRAPAW